ncbi:transposase [Nitrogeniibacter mangrovi]|uniref:Transposase n=1 Tax=Nitrogeniibacter mangrovi TaxID=2016596 RepID=A0A6C1BAE9_9RHOO|nr:Mu transposase C-terminal domain-containing protein [Nitrogeniibacter mangrovi]QID19360.1 transposase [Nitrogeniibacter mangrovi]
MTTAAFVTVKPGAIVGALGKKFKITHILGVDNVLAEDLESRRIERLSVDQLEPASSASTSLTEGIPTPDLEDISDGDWKQAHERFAIISPLLADQDRTRAKVEQAAATAGVHAGTIYEWIKLYTNSLQLSSLIPQKRGRRRGNKGLDESTEKIVRSAIEDAFLSKQRLRPQEVINRVATMCRTAGIDAPHPNTVRNRIRELRPDRVLRARGHSDQARNKFAPIRGNFPGADFPLAVVQIDHTEADIIVVEDETRLPMGRPTVTLAIDVFSRMITGVYVSMEKPSAVAAGMCLANSMSPKNEYLAALEVPGEWPVWGRIAKVHCDNAKEFRGAMLSKACEQYAIDLEMRPVKVPHYGGHIERYMGTSGGEIRTLPGTTFSNTRERKGYDSEKESALTLKEFEQRLVDFIVNVYHKRLHSELEMPPLRKWEIGLLGDSTQPGKGIPEVPSNPHRLRLDFLPFVERTIQPYGVVIDDVFYYHEVLNPWINATEPNQSRIKRKFIIRRDPRDISVVYFYDPEAREYYEIPYRNAAHPPISLWELRAAQKRLRAEGEAHVDEEAIFDAVERMRARVEAAVTKTKAARRQIHRIKTTKRQAKSRATQPAERAAPERTELQVDRTPMSDPMDDDIFGSPIQPFDIKV